MYRESENKSSNKKLFSLFLLTPLIFLFNIFSTLKGTIKRIIMNLEYLTLQLTFTNPVEDLLCKR